MPDHTALLQQIQQIKDNNSSAMAIVGSSALAIIKQRIYGEGKDSNGNPIGSYSTKPTLVGKTSFITTTAANKLLGSKNKRSKLQWVTISGRRLAVLPGGYKKIRQLEGRQTRTVDLRRSGTMENAHSFQVITNGFELGFTNVKQGEIMEFNEGRFQTDISKLSDQEIEELTEILLSEVFE